MMHTVSKASVFKIALVSVLIFGHSKSFAQKDDFLFSSDGKEIISKKEFILSFKNSLSIAPDNNELMSFCECQFSLLNRRFKFSDIKEYTKKYKESAFTKLIDRDSILKNQMEECQGKYIGLLLSNPSYRESFIGKCTDNLKSSDSSLTDSKATAFCNCAANIIQKRKITASRISDIYDPSSFLYNEVAYTCGSLTTDSSDRAREWKAANVKDVAGADIDSIQIISIAGMNKVKVTIAGETKIWMIDSGASDLLISEDFAKVLREKGLLSDASFIGESKYILANKKTMICKTYKIDSVQLGHFKVSKLVIAVSKDTRDFLLGKTFLNKFTSWSIDNKNSILILRK